MTHARWYRPIVLATLGVACSAVLAAHTATAEAFTYSPASPQVGQTVTFYGDTTIPDYSCCSTWTFDDGASVNAGAAPVTHAFGTPGVHTVTETLICTECDRPRKRYVNQSVTVTGGTLLTFDNLSAGTDPAHAYPGAWITGGCNLGETAPAGAGTTVTPDASAPSAPNDAWSPNCGTEGATPVILVDFSRGQREVALHARSGNWVGVGAYNANGQVVAQSSASGSNSPWVRLDVKDPLGAATIRRLYIEAGPASARVIMDDLATSDPLL